MNKNYSETTIDRPAIEWYWPIAKNISEFFDTISQIYWLFIIDHSNNYTAYLVKGTLSFLQNLQWKNMWLVQLMNKDGVLLLSLYKKLTCIAMHCQPISGNKRQIWKSLNSMHCLAFYSPYHTHMCVLSQDELRFTLPKVNTVLLSCQES